MNIKQIQQMAKQAQRMQEQMQARMAEMRIEATAGGGMVKVVVNGLKQIHALTIDPEVVSKDDVEMLQDLIVAAINDAQRKADDKKRDDRKPQERARDDIGPYLQRRWRELADHPLVGEVRGVGMIGALELVAHKGSRTFFRNRGATGLICRDHCFNNGLVMRATRDTMIMAPPLVIGRSEVDEMIEKARRCLDLTAADIGAG